jgi:hypothetical protein
MKKIDGEAKTIKKLLNGARFTIDYYQREYKWETKQVTELIDDLVEKFEESYEAGHERSEVEKYGHYFVGSIIISQKDGHNFIIDGQQRLTTLTLLLIHLNNLQASRNDKVIVSELIFSEKYARKSFNIDVDDRKACMEAPYGGEVPDEDGHTESVQNIIRRFQDIGAALPYEDDAPELPYFIDWLIENVHLVEITAYSDDDAYTIFETMNDRGLSLRPADMLKGYLLANVKDTDKRIHASDTWKAWMEEFRTLAKDGKDEDADFFKTWLRSQHAQTIRERKKGAKPEDYDRIGTEFHRWVRDNKESLGLAQSTDFASFIERDMDFYAAKYLKLRQAVQVITPPLERVFSNAWIGFTLQYPLLLAPLRIDDGADTIERKIRVVAAFVDILLARRMWNWRSISHSTMQYAMFLVMRDIRGATLEDLIELLTTRLDDPEAETFATQPNFSMHQMNRWPVHHLLALMTDYVERESGLTSRYAEYSSTGKKRYEIEHIWADKPERFKQEFSHPADFRDYRNRVGGLLLLPKTFNASYGDKPYEKKLPHYLGQNLLAKSLHPDCYEHNPGFLAFRERSGLPFEPCEHFGREQLDKRQDLYRALAEHTWSPTRLRREAEP